MFTGYLRPAIRPKPINVVEVLAWALAMGTILIVSSSLLGVRFIAGM
jgi:hypothetical protein